MVERQSRSDFDAAPPRKVSAFSAMARGSASANEIVLALRGSPPVRATARLSAATRRASATLTSSALPSPMSTRRPCTMMRWTHEREPESRTRSIRPLPST